MPSKCTEPRSAFRVSVISQRLPLVRITFVLLAVWAFFARCWISAALGACMDKIAALGACMDKIALHMVLLEPRLGAPREISFDVALRRVVGGVHHNPVDVSLASSQSS